MFEIKYCFFRYTDLFGYQRVRMVPATAFETTKSGGVGFAMRQNAVDI